MIRLVKTKDVVRLLSKITIKDKYSCWEHSGAKDLCGYVQFKTKRDGRTFNDRVHRVAYTLCKGEIPKGMVVRHKCHNPCCCNPNHLILGTDADNMRDKVKAGRQATGTRFLHSRLNDEAVREIRSLYSAGVRKADIARKFDVAYSTVNNVILSHRWKHVT